MILVSVLFGKPPVITIKSPLFKYFSIILFIKLIIFLLLISKELKKKERRKPPFLSHENIQNINPFNIAPTVVKIGNFTRKICLIFDKFSSFSNFSSKLNIN